MISNQVIKCSFWPTCGAVIASDYQAKLKYPAGDPCRDRIGTICDNEVYKNCYFYLKRVEKAQEIKIMEGGESR